MHPLQMQSPACFPSNSSIRQVFAYASISDASKGLNTSQARRARTNKMVCEERQHLVSLLIGTEMRRSAHMKTLSQALGSSSHLPQVSSQPQQSRRCLLRAALCDAAQLPSNFGKLLGRASHPCRYTRSHSLLSIPSTRCKRQTLRLFESELHVIDILLSRESRARSARAKEGYHTSPNHHA
jgi:hypothetical protein